MKHRIVTDSYLGYEVQIKVWWWPFWVQRDITNTHRTLDKAKKYIEESGVVWEEGAGDGGD